MAEALKNRYNRPFLQQITGALAAVHPPFDSQHFTVRVFDAEWESRELKDRMRHITRCLGACLPADYPEALAILKKASDRLLKSPPKDMGFLGMFFPDFAEVYGLENPDLSLPALAHFTPLASSEFAIRPFLMRYPAQSLATLMLWAQHENPHVRRLASEGSRPRLPWAMALPAFKADPAPVLPILERLRDDPELYVRRSVANHLNDISKDHPATVIATLRRWQAGAGPERQWIIRHATRSLIKAGHPEALELLGFSAGPRVELKQFSLSPRAISLGEHIDFSFELHELAGHEQALVIDYVLHFMKANGRQAPKVFKLREKVLMPGAVISIQKRHVIRPITTRAYYPGTQRLEIQVNGQAMGSLTFELNME